MYIDEDKKNSAIQSLPDLLALISRCVDCGGTLKHTNDVFQCQSCHREFTCDEQGVWDFRTNPDKTDIPAIFKETEYKRWHKVFGEEERKSWVIYKNSLYRFFSQAGHRHLAKQINQYGQPEDFIVEIGAGTGALLDFIPGKNYIGVDVSVDSLRQLKKKWPQTVAMQAFATALPFENDAFANVVSLHTLEHIYPLAESLEEMERIMTPKGQMHYVIPTEGGLSFWLGRMLITGPHLRKQYDLDVTYVMDREHINDAPRVLKFLRLHFNEVTASYWPLRFLRLLSPNAMIFGSCSGARHK